MSKAKPAVMPPDNTEWEDILPRSGTGARRDVSVSVSAELVKIYVAHNVAEQLGWKQREKVLVRVGKGTQLGKVRVIADERGYIVHRQNSGKTSRLTITMRAWRGAAQTVWATPVIFTVDDGVLELEMPAEQQIPSSGA